MIKFTYGLPVALLGAAVVVIEVQRAMASIPPQVRDIGKNVTVRIDGAGSGSGIIIRGDGNTYTVLTCWHVVQNKGSYTVRTGNGKPYQVNYSTVRRVGNIDLAEFEFTSNENYRPVEIGNSGEVTAGSTVYAFGWATPDQVSKRREYVPLETTARVVSQPVSEYALVLSNTVKPGMSGGPILDEQGRLIGVSGLSKIDARLDTRDFLGIPINTYKQVASVSGISQQERSASTQRATGVSVSTTTTEKAKAKKFFRQAYDKSMSGDEQGAIDDYTLAIKIDPNYAAAYHNRGSIRSALGDKQGAINDYNQAIQINPDYAYAYYGRGNTRYDLNDMQGARDDYTLAIKTDPNFAIAYHGRGNAHYVLGDKQAAISDLQQAVRLYQQQGGNEKWLREAQNTIRELQQ